MEALLNCTPEVHNIIHMDIQGGQDFCLCSELRQNCFFPLKCCCVWLVLWAYFVMVVGVALMGGVLK